MIASSQFKLKSRLFLCARVALGLALLLGAPRARAADAGDLGTLFVVDDSDPVKSIPSEEERNRHPLEFGYFLQDLIAHAEASLHRDDYAHAVNYYEALARIVPDRALVFSRLCLVYAKLGKNDVASAYCQRAIALPGAVVNDHLEFIRTTLLKQKFGPDDVARIDQSLAHLRAHVPSLTPPPVASASAGASNVQSLAAVIASANAAGGAAPTSSAARAELAKAIVERAAQGTVLANPQPTEAARVNLPVEVEVLACRLAVKLKDDKRLTDCTATLTRYHTDPRLVMSFEWSHALIDGDRGRASALLEQARSLHVSKAVLKVMTDEQDREFKTGGIAGLVKRLGAVAVAVLAAFAGAVLVGFWWTVWGSKRRRVGSAQT